MTFVALAGDEFTQSYAPIFKQFAALIGSTRPAVSLVRVLKADLDGLAEAAAIVAKGGLIAYPTDTVYGLGCDPLNTSAVERALSAKGGRTKAMPILVKGLKDADKVAHVSGGARRLAQAFWPGPLTIVLRARDVLPPNLVPERTVGVRSPNHPICLELLGLCSGFLVGTSANLTGKPPATTAEEVLKEFGGRVDFVLDGGRSSLGVASTVVDLTKNHFTFLREGPIGRGEIMRCFKERRPR